MATADCLQIALISSVQVYKAPISNSAEKQYLNLCNHFKTVSFYYHSLGFWVKNIGPWLVEVNNSSRCRIKEFLNKL